MSSKGKHRDDGEFFLECKAAFLSIYDDINDRVESKKALNTLLQQSGRNPTRVSLNKYWPGDTDQLSFDEYVDICRNEPVTSADDLMKAFRKIDINGDGYISLEELYKIMNGQGEKMSKDDVKKMIDEVDENKDGRLDYGEFTNMIMKTTEESKKFTKKVMEKKERRKNRTEKSRFSGIDSSKQRPGSASSQRSSLSQKHDEQNSARSRDGPRRDSYRLETSPKRDTPRSSRFDSPTSPKMTKHDSDTDTLSVRPGHNSARTVGEEIDYDDDFDIVSTGRPTPRVDLNNPVNKTPRKDDSKSARSNMGSRSSLRDEKGDKDIIGAPVPSPRKTISSRLSEDDVPKPSPRVTKGSKGKSPSTKSRDKLPDPKTLKDWVHCTSKGSFFYEEEEIVTHVYNLKLTEESFVYLSAYPIQEPSCLSLPGMEPVDTALFIFDSRGRLVTFTEQRDIKGKYGVQQKLSAGDYQILPYTTGCRFKQRAADQQDQMKEAKLVKRDKDEKIVITSAFRRALEDIFDLCDLDNNGTMSKDEFNWFNLRTSGEELGEDEWEVVEERTSLEEGEITKAGFIELNEMEAEDADGDVEDLWITLSSMGLNKALIMDEACPYRLDVYVQEKPELAKKRPTLKVTGIESLEKGEFAQEICTALMEKSQSEPVKVRNMKDLYMYTYRNEHKASIIIDNRSRSTVNIEIDCSRSKNVTSNRTELDYTLDVDPQQTAIAHHLLPKSELNEWTVNCTETIHK